MVTDVPMSWASTTTAPVTVWATTVSTRWACSSRLYRCGRGLSDKPKPRKSIVTQAWPVRCGITARKSNELDG
ncbi:Uncharacterised protein [Mycobacterium tuberculosis]|uniref:Uncharacterized protein n=1 Tax=Mycobacterium tuberculosis TaxID=1773 RepID=A0A655AQ33_MYCTX|nr:Uncharacterised protein [Mycobacterium tuberculosis]CKU08070.1 Uncharacterised protein [Mycobacterium tuberculosis]SGO56214.1 Uncharacterised protein [Mycobacterium tuberculosis]